MKTKNGFSLIEVLIYTAVLAVIIVIVFNFFSGTLRFDAKSRSLREISENTRLITEKLAYQIREASGIYEPTSIFNASPGQLSLETTKNLSTGETATYIDFHLCGGRFCFKQEGKDAIFLSSEKVKLSNLIFSLITTSTTPSVQTSFKIEYNNETGRPEYNASADIKFSVSLRNYD